MALTPAPVPRAPDADAFSIRVRRALDRLSLYVNALVSGGVLIVNNDGSVTINTDVLTGPAGEDGTDADLTLEAEIAQCKNALRFLGIEPNEFPQTDSFPQEVGL